MYFEIECKTKDLYTILSGFVNESNIHKFKQSPKVERYRNNILYSIGYNEKNEIEIGPLQKSKLVKNSSFNLTSSELANNICEFVKVWITSFSKLPIIKYNTMKGFWRHINIRNNLKKDFLIIFRFNDFDKYSKIWKDEVNYFIDYMKDVSYKNKYNMKGIYYQKCEGKREPRVDDPIYKEYFENNLIENIINTKFIIDPLAFFQVNTYTARMIFETVRNIIKKDNEGILFDLCCGMGVYSLILGNYFKKTVGIDNSLKNIFCASENVILNNVTKCSFICERVENVFSSSLDLHKNEKIYVVLNPPRRGVYPEVIEALNRNIDRIEQIIYVSCYAPTLNSDLNKLNFENKDIRNIIPINQFPNTEHYEIIVDIY